MIMYSDKFISLLRCQDAQRVMANNGHYPTREHNGRLYYKCPFHDDTHPSFSIESKNEESDYHVQRFVCASCGTSGAGTLELQALFMSKPEADDEVVSVVSSFYGIIPQGKEDQSHYSRTVQVSAQSNYSFDYNERISDADLEALGCQRRMVYAVHYDDDGMPVRTPIKDGEGRPRFAYSWGDGYYSQDDSKYEDDPDYVNFDRTELTRVFGLRSVKSFVTAAKANRKGEVKSYRVASSPSYPILNFTYGTEEQPWGKKYEPFYRPGHKGIKFMFWYGAGTRRPKLAEQVYGDIDVVTYLQTGDIKETKVGEKAVPLFMHTETNDMGDTVTSKLFRDLIICSGPRDAMSVYFHSSAHVVWFNSETTDISWNIFEKLRACCENMYILYDIDQTGIEESNRLAMKFFGLRIIRLPKALTKVTDPRTGKPGKDAENFFTLYKQLNRVECNRFYGDSESRFEKLMRNSTRMDFFTERYRERKKKGGKISYFDYEISGNSAIQVAGARNINRFYIDNDRYLYVKRSREDHLWDIISEKEIENTVRQELKLFAEEANNVKDYDKLCDCITKTSNLSKGVCGQLPEVELDIRAFNEEMEHFAFRNGVVRVTPDSITEMKYKASKFHFFRNGAVDDTFDGVLEPTFRIVRNTEALQQKRKEIDSLKTKGMSNEAKDLLESQYMEYEKLWGWRLEWLLPYEQQPIIVRFLYETGRIYWKEERSGLPLDKEKKQEQDLHFIVKVAALGYSLSRYRDPSKAYIVQWTDYTSMINGKSSGRTGKSILGKLKFGIRNAVLVNGKEIQKKENFSKNFSDFQQGVHTNILIDDLDLSVGEEQFFNLNTDMKVKTLYQDVVSIKPEDCPKVEITSNRKPDMDSSSVRGRFWMVPVGGPIGIRKQNGVSVEVSARSLFGVNIPTGLFGIEKKYYQNCMMWCLQFWLRHKEIIRPYMGHSSQEEVVQDKVGNDDFVAWANDYFSDESVFGVPLNRRDMMLDFYEHLNKPISILNANKEMQEFKDMLEKYCGAHEGWVLTPEVCLMNYSKSRNLWEISSKNRNERALVASGWTYAKDEGGYKKTPVEYTWKKDERYIYVYQSVHDIPPHNEDIPRPDKNNPPVCNTFEETENL